MISPFSFFGAGEPFVPDADATAYIDAVVAAGGVFTGQQENAIQAFYKGLKSDGLYTEIKFMYPLFGGTKETHAISGIAPTDTSKNLVWYGELSTDSTTHAAKGVDAREITNGYAEYPFAPSDDFTAVDNVAVGILSLDSTVDNQGYVVGLMANTTGTNSFEMKLPDVDSIIDFKVGSDPQFPVYDVGTILFDGFYLGSNQGGTSKIYKDGSEVASVTSTSGALPTDHISFFSADASSANQQNIYVGFIIGTNGLDATQASKLNLRINTLASKLGKTSEAGVITENLAYHFTAENSDYLTNTGNLNFYNQGSVSDDDIVAANTGTYGGYFKGSAGTTTGLTDVNTDADGTTLSVDRYQYYPSGIGTLPAAPGFNQLTLSGWFWLTTVTTVGSDRGMFIFHRGNNDGYYVTMEVGGAIATYNEAANQGSGKTSQNQGYHVTTNQLLPNQWYNVVATFNGNGEHNIYVNGVNWLSITNQTWTTATHTGGKLYTGAQSSFSRYFRNDNYWNDIMVYEGKALTSDEVNKNFEIQRTYYGI